MHRRHALAALSLVAAFPTLAQPQRPIRLIVPYPAGGALDITADDIERLNRITDLLAEGLNLAGIAMVLELQDGNTRLREDQRRRDEPEG